MGGGKRKERKEGIRKGAVTLALEKDSALHFL